MSKIPFGPTYDEMLNPSSMDQNIRALALKALKDNELDPVNLFNITWKNDKNDVNKIILPKEITGVDANIVVLLGKYFPSGSHKVGPAYSMLMEGCVDGNIIPSKNTILAPSSGNFGIGVSYITKLMNFSSLVIMPEGMSKERYERIQKYGAKIDLTSGNDTGIILTLKRTNELKKDPINKVLAQFELFSNYRFHRYVTGNSAIEAVKDIGNGKIACFCCATGSAGTIAAGDGIKSVYKDCKVAALEPKECSTLTNGKTGQHKIEGVGDKIIPLIHNVLSTDYVAQISSDDCVKGLMVIHEGKETLKANGVKEEDITKIADLFGVSGICNILGAIKMAKYLNLGKDDNVVTVATDSFDRYPSVLNSLLEKEGKISIDLLDNWFNEVFKNVDSSLVLDTSSIEEKNRLFKQKENDWMMFGYTKYYLDNMKKQEFWDNEFNKIDAYNKKILELRGKEIN